MFDLTALTIYGGFSNKSIEQVLERVLRKHSIKIVELKPKKLILPSAATIGSFLVLLLKKLNLKELMNLMKMKELKHYILLYKN